ncbi:Calx-beta domain-containing protein [Bradyrhizobium sp. CCBAU 51753]|uniref:beta strand repeat-containing protein n=1 Tax=Bradyrhizobium sp. CCBAU 51753 TaxID=1325100 RepID=UPI00188A45F4|nr:Calx-beta domain-containing protein [Bradyrhizobium sp. CCBAU 51753]QOZ22711.1 hypothetical protein XH93_02870 [Bradyrhizobium sp. CCBAU 51753]
MTNFVFVDGDDDAFTIDSAHQRHVNPGGLTFSTVTSVSAFTAAQFAGVSFWAIDSSNLSAFQSGAAFSGVRLGADNFTGFISVNLAPGTWYLGITTNSSFTGGSIPTYSEMSTLSLPGESFVGNVPMRADGNAGAWDAQGFTITGNVQQFWEAEASAGVYVIMNDELFGQFQAAYPNGYTGGSYAYLTALGNGNGGNTSDIDAETFLPAGHYYMVWINNSTGWAGGAANLTGFSASAGNSIGTTGSGGSGGGGGGGGNTGVNLTTTLLDVNTNAGIGLPSTTTVAGGDVIFHYHVNNSGSTSASAGAVGYYISSDPTITTSDRQITYGNLFDAVPANGSSQDYFVDIKLPADIAPGTWYVGVIANSTQQTVETNYADNPSAGLPITITGSSTPSTPTLSIVPVSANKAEGSSGGSTPFTFEIDRSGSTTSTSSVNWVISLNNQPAANGADFVGPLSGSVSFAAGETSKLITVNVAADTVVESNEIFQVDLYGAAGATINPSNASAQGIIQNDDSQATLSIVPISASKAEGSSGGSTPFTFEVDRSGSAAAAASVNWVISLNNAPAANGADFVGPLSGSLSFAAGETSKLITVNVAADTVPESDELFQVDLYGASGAAVNPAAASAIGMIFNDDAQPTLSIVPVSANKAEGSSGGSTPFTFEVDRSGSSSIASFVNWVISLNNQPAANGADFVGPLSGMLSFAAGETAKLITVNIAADTVVESNEIFQVDLYGAAAATINPGAASAIGTIQNDDIPPPVLSIVPVSANKAEGSSGGSTPFTFEVDRVGSTAAASSVNWVISLNNPPAANGADFAGPLSGSLSFAAGETSKLITVNIAADTVVESNEIFQVDLYGASGAGINASAGSAVGIIQNDDIPPPVLSIVPVSASKAEGSSGGSTPFTFEVDRNGSTASASSVNWVISLNNAPAANGVDFVGPLSGALTFAAGETSKLITINVAADKVLEPTEIFQVDLYGAANATIAPSAASAIGAIQNDDTAPIVSIAPLSADKAEGDSGLTPFTFNVSRGGDTSGSTSVNWVMSLNNTPAANGTDFSGALSGALTFAAGETTKTVTINVVGDTAFENNEAFQIDLYGVSNGTIDSHAASALGHILNDDALAGLFTAGNDTVTLPGPGGVYNALDGDDTVFGTTLSDYIVGGAGNDRLFGGTGSPNTLQGGTGNDTYFVEASGDSIVEFAGEGTDTVQTPLTTFVLPANVENLTHTGSSDFVGVGNGSDNILIAGGGSNYLVGLGGNDTLIGGGSAPNTLQGGAGDDIYAVQSNQDTVYEVANEGTDTVQTFLANYVLPANVENLTFIGPIAHDGTGNVSNNVFTGTAASDTFTGAGGSDTFNYRQAGGGFDTITDFNANNADASGHDHIDLTGRGLNFAQLAVTTVAGGVVVGIPGGDAIFLKNVVVSQIDTGDFFF